MNDDTNRDYDDGLEDNSEDTPEEPLIVSVVDEDGVEHTFEQLDELYMDDKEYVALVAVYDDDEIAEEDDELIILLRQYEGDDVYLAPIEDDEEFDRVGAAFEKRLSDRYEFEE